MKWTSNTLLGGDVLLVKQHWKSLLVPPGCVLYHEASKKARIVLLSTRDGLVTYWPVIIKQEGEIKFVMFGEARDDSIEVTVSKPCIAKLEKYGGDFALILCWDNVFACLGEAALDAKLSTRVGLGG